ncbi:YeeE/YedE family protein [Marinobacterium weihaiense]|uniref:YeeE/YedE family protein n=1 Tax=Marinobacterium weihaiense TaxID=2851016 RepID=A0ABS6M6A6_9GAMM|nr:YeeE/YedE family protein [Marinobacterium weihaiense]MBV0931797.1 YeeE/YedE family protein [Marinobacterium weihaiense]
MTIVNFTPWPALIGGALIGLAAAFLLYAKGRIAGISGIAGGVIYPESKGDIGWRIVFLVGLVLGGLLYQLTGFGAGVEHIQAVVSKPWLIAGGLLVGIGTQIGSGCTSGHGICGLARRSPRSLVATLCFMGSALLTVFVTRHLLGAA